MTGGRQATAGVALVVLMVTCFSAMETAIRWLGATMRYC
jgi:hypothetical protein